MEEKASKQKTIHLNKAILIQFVLHTKQLERDACAKIQTGPLNFYEDRPETFIYALGRNFKMTVKINYAIVIDISSILLLCSFQSGNREVNSSEVINFGNLSETALCCKEWPVMSSRDIREGGCWLV